MGNSSSDPFDLFSTSAPRMEPERPWTPQPPRRAPVWRHVVLFLLTVVTTVEVGAHRFEVFQFDFVTRTGPEFSSIALMLNGLWYGASILAILGAHEFGHYFACRHYGVDASLPYFLPVPALILPLTGTLGAFIRIRQPIPTKRELFDIGIAGPIAGFVVAVPLLIAGISFSKIAQIPPDASGFTTFELGEPLLLKAVAWMIWGTPPEGYTLSLHPMAFAAWFGLLATALNLFPIGQLDGGHISYAVLGRRSTAVTFVTVAALIALTFFSTSWLVWAILTVVMLAIFGPRHPSTVDEHVPLDRTRMWFAAGAVVMFILCFTPAPLEILSGP